MIRNASLTLFSITLLIFGCNTQTPGPDINAGIFQTAPQLATQRSAAEMDAWQESACSAVRSDRPDIKPTKLAPPYIQLSADGYTQQVDLSSAFIELRANHGANARQVMQKYLENVIPGFDQHRLEAIGFAGASPNIQPLLINTHQQSASTQPFHDHPLLGGMAWRPAVYLPGGAIIPISTPTAARWKQSPQQLEAVALTNLAKTFSANSIEITALSANMSVAHLKTGVNPGVILLPDFLPVMQKAWDTDSSILVLVNNQFDVRLAKKSDEDTVKMIWPAWRSVTANPDALSSVVLEISSSDMAPFFYKPPAASRPSAVTQPASKPATREMHFDPSLPPPSF